MNHQAQLPSTPVRVTWRRGRSSLQSHPDAFSSGCRMTGAWKGVNEGTSLPVALSPELDHPRVSFFPGWFEETIPLYVWPDHDVLVVMLDADL